jgi:hypothetical protein
MSNVASHSAEHVWLRPTPTKHNEKPPQISGAAFFVDRLGQELRDPRGWPASFDPRELDELVRSAATGWPDLDLTTRRHRRPHPHMAPARPQVATKPDSGLGINVADDPCPFSQTGASNAGEITGCKVPP